jgi:hypothetical protein
MGMKYQDFDHLRQSESEVTITTDVAKTVGVKVRLLRSLCGDHPHHPLSIEKLKSVRGLSEDHTVYCDEEDLMAIAEEGEVVVDREVIGRELRRVKRFVPSGRPTVAKAKETPPKPSAARKKTDGTDAESIE